jgi:hypothetical protein
MVNRLSFLDDCYHSKSKAVYLITDRTMTEPTYSAPGMGESHYKCKNCNSETKQTYKIAQKTAQNETYSRPDSNDSYSDDRALLITAAGLVAVREVVAPVRNADQFHYL